MNTDQTSYGASVDVLAEMAKSFDKTLLEWVQKGVPVLKLGQVIYREDGQPLRRPMNAAEGQMIRMRLANCNMSVPHTGNSDIEQVGDAMGASVVGRISHEEIVYPEDLPPVSMCDETSG